MLIQTRISNQSYDRSISNLHAQTSSSTFCLLLRVLLLVVRFGSVISVLGLHDVIIVNCNIKTFMRDNLLCLDVKFLSTKLSLKLVELESRSFTTIYLSDLRIW